MADSGTEFQMVDKALFLQTISLNVDRIPLVAQEQFNSSQPGGSVSQRLEKSLKLGLVLSTIMQYEPNLTTATSMLN